MYIMRRIIEFRQYALQIGSALKYINATRQNASLRKELFFIDTLFAFNILF